MGPMMTICRECRESVSSEAATCPHCGIDRPGWRDPALQPAPRPVRPQWKPGDAYTDDVVPRPSEQVGALRRPKRGGAYKVGQRVHCNRRGGPKGYGAILAVSTELGRGGGTKLHPTFLVQLDDGQRLWFSAIALSKAHTS